MTEAEVTMTSTDGALHLAVVEVTASRPDQPVYHAKVQTLIARVLDDGRDGGWRVTRHAAADVSTPELLAATDDADAIVIVGGEDITPRFYGGERGYEGETRHYEGADAGQIALVRRALTRLTPLLGICRGMQIVNVALGGSIIQHIGDDGLHRTPDVPIDQILTAHEVDLVPGTGLAGSLGGSSVLVQSAHHQSVGPIGEDLLVAAFAPDGLVEAVEHVPAPITGVQWHPEAPDAPADQLPLLLEALQRRVLSLEVAA
jgi:putative glutamine amidotransferase